MPIRFTAFRSERPVKSIDGSVSNFEEAKEFAGAMLVVMGAPIRIHEVRFVWEGREWRMRVKPGTRLAEVHWRWISETGSDAGPVKP